MNILMNVYFDETGNATWDEKKEAGWKERMDDWKMQQGNLGPEPEDDPDAALYVPFANQSTEANTINVNKII